MNPPNRKPERRTREEISKILKQDIPPRPDSLKRTSCIHRLTLAAFDMDYLGRQAFLPQIFAQISYLSPWSFLLQACFTAVIFYFSRIHSEILVTACVISLTPILTGILLYELSKSFEFCMWELESACRCNLAKVFALRLCILSGTNFIVLAASLIAFHSVSGTFWEFACYALLPFFLGSALCLLLLQHLGNRWGHFTLLSLCAISAAGEFSFYSFMKNFLYGETFPLAESFLWIKNAERYMNTKTLNTVFLWISLGALLLFLLCALRLCTKKYYVYADSFGSP